MQFTWTMGRRLASAINPNGDNIAYTYNADGLRTSKTVNNEKYIYYWNGNKLTAQTWGENSMYFRYDGDTPIGLEFDGVKYYYVVRKIPFVGKLIASKIPVNKLIKSIAGAASSGY